MKLAVVGSRNFTDYDLLKSKLDYINNLKQITCIVSGGAKGADKLAEKWASDKGIDKDIHYPNWKEFGKKAAFIRNEDIVKNCDRLIAFQIKKSKGTQHSINLAKRFNKPYKVIRYYTLMEIRYLKIMRILQRRKFRL